MPLTKTGKSVLRGMKKQYGAVKGERVFYSSINARKPGASKWHRKGK
jgi:hypothetical protein